MGVSRTLLEVPFGDSTGTPGWGRPRVGGRPLGGVLASPGNPAWKEDFLSWVFRDEAETWGTGVRILCRGEGRFQGGERQCRQLRGWSRARWVWAGGLLATPRTGARSGRQSKAVADVCSKPLRFPPLI